MLLAEANQWPEEAAAYFGAGNECHMAFHFPLMPRLFMAIRREDRFPLVDILAQTPALPDNAQWALFLRNHDELTLEMVTDEERLYMYRVYAHEPAARVNLGIRRRLAPLLHNDRRRIELMNTLLFSLPGTPVIYYGDEIGMGDNIYLGDRNGVRTPMQWSADRNAGFSRAHPQQLYLPLIVDHEYHHESTHVEAQQSNPYSLLAWMRRIIALRKRYQAFGRGTLEFLHPENRKVLAFLRVYEAERLLVVANLSRFVQHVELDLSAFQGAVPVELFGRVAFPPVGELPYFITLGPHAFYWFALEPAPAPGAPGERAAVPSLTTADGWETVIHERSKHALEGVLPDYLCTRRWFRGAPYRLLGARVIESVPLRFGARLAHLGVVRVDYADHDPELYLLPLAFVAGKQARAIQDEHPEAIIANLTHRVRGRQEEGVLYDALWDPAFAHALLAAIARRNQLHGTHGTIAGDPRPALRGVRRDRSGAGRPRIVPGDLNNTSIAFGERLMLKVFRCIDEGVNPDVEVAAFLTDRHFPHTPALAGTLEYRRAPGTAITLGIVERFVPHEGHAWDTARQALAAFFAAVGDQDDPAPEAALDTRTLLDLARQEPEEGAAARIGPFLDAARLLGRRTAELHLALGSDREHPEFRPQPFTPYYQRSRYQAMRRLTNEALDTLRRHVDRLPEPLQADARRILHAQPAILDHFKRMATGKISAERIRCHGDFRLEQVLDTGGDFAFIDFEGEPGRLMAERRLKYSPLRDVASMLVSFHTVAGTALAATGDERAAGGERSAPPAPALESWARYWVRQVGAAFLGEYLRGAGAGSFLPPAEEELFVLLDTLLLERLLVELDQALRHRPARVGIPLSGLLQFV
jgi:maltose alpha-D-glucosyltransferase/alpha-amylase